ncbi:MAG: dTMP kinase [Ignavibacteria bacterium]|nr:dTMP kinase [Ignavibacteria bacterium]
MLITFEGLDLSGKSTQARMLLDRLASQGFEVVFIREPGGTDIGEKIRAILLDTENKGISDEAEFLLFSASRAQIVRERIQPALEAGAVVVCDRFYDSSTAYQGWGRGIPVSAVEAINMCAAAGLAPDVTFFLDLPVAEIERRLAIALKEKDRMESNGRAFYERVRNGYLEIARQQPRVTVLDATKPINELHEEVWRRVVARGAELGKHFEKEEA